MSWPMPSNPCLWLHGPPAPNAVTVVRMMSGFTRRRLSRSSASPRNTSGGRLATTTSAVPTSLRTISRPSALDGSSVIARGGDPPVLATTPSLDPDDVGAEIGEERRTVRPRNVAAEIEDSNACQNVIHRAVGRAHPVLPPAVMAGLVSAP